MLLEQISIKAFQEIFWQAAAVVIRASKPSPIAYKQVDQRNKWMTSLNVARNYIKKLPQVISVSNMEAMEVNYKGGGEFCAGLLGRILLDDLTLRR